MSLSRGRKLAVLIAVPCLLAVGLALLWRGAPRSPVVLTIWHNPTGHREDALSLAVDRFNRSVGREKGVAILVTTVAKAEIIHEKLMSIAAGDPGAPEPPDIVIAYPKSVLPLIGKGRMVAFDEHFSAQELSDYIPSFIEAGRIHEGRLYSFPIGRGTEGLILNRTLWDRFSEAAGAPLSELSTLEGLARTAAKYYRWTSAQTSDGNGRMFFMVDNPFNLAQAAFAQMGEDLFVEGRLNVESPLYERVWRLLFEPAVKGREAVYKGYGTDLAKTGAILCWTSATAGITFMPERVIYADNTSEPVRFEILPFPVLEGCRKKVSILRSGGFSLFRSTPRREEAAVAFLKWLTRPEENLRYVDGTGYLPVTRRAIETARASWGTDAKGIWKSFVDAIATMERDYEFLPQSPLPNYGELEILYERRLWAGVTEAREKYQEALRYGDSEEDAFRAVEEEAWRNFAGQ